MLKKGADALKEFWLLGAKTNTLPTVVDVRSSILPLLNLNQPPLRCHWCGFGLLLYGSGSKKALMEDFASTVLKEHSIVMINGYLQSINMKHAFSSWISFVVLITLVEVLCDQLKLRHRTLFKNLPKAQQPFNSLSMCGTERWVTHSSTGAGIYSRYANQSLYKISRDSFLVGNQITLNSHLTKFKDHELVKTRRHSDGQGCLLSLLHLKRLKNCCLKLVIRSFSSL
ncbi:hypothetical protein Patl1_14385 [Pistacia atlantica]|uniref:Uncharacterized protein n=1 Tax=Pistacia atlantica TaxID=434234 RepID=A0ACC1AUL3_9ROSI|nr:hypothetical protein Patl1_14385 [Pistacia atlantica]